MISLRRSLIAAQPQLPYNYKPVEFLYRTRDFAGPYCTLNWSLDIGDRVVSKALMLGPSGQESAFAGNGTSSPYLEIYYGKAGTPTSWTQGGTIASGFTTLGIPTKITVTAGSELLYTYYGAYRPGDYKFRGRLYGATVTNSAGQIKHDIIPCIRKIDNEPGFYDIKQKIFYPNASTTGTFEIPVYIGGICVYQDNAFYTARGNAGPDQYTENSDWFIAGPFDTGNSNSKSYTCSRYNGTGSENWLRIFDNINSTSYDYWTLGATSTTPRTFSTAGRYILVGVYKPNAADSYIYDNTNQRYVFKGNNVT